MASGADVVLLSNFKTRNLGNLALTTTVQRLLADAYGADHLISVHRMPHPIVEVATRGPLDGWVTRVESQLGPLDTLGPPPRTAYGEQTPGLASLGKEQGEPSATRAVATRLAHTGLGTRVRARLERQGGRVHAGAIVAASDVVWNPGGELNEHSTPYGRMLDLAIALQQEHRASIVNFSLEATPAALAYFERVGPRLHQIIGRDERTVSAMVDLGVEQARLSPDAVFLVGSPVLPELPLPPPPPRREVIGIVLHGLTSIDAGSWATVVNRARRAGLAVEILSSHKTVDGRVIKQLLDETGDDGVTVLPEFTDIPTYLTHLGQLQAVVTGRFHSAVMGLLCGTTVVGVDTYGTKIAGGLAAAGFGGAIAAGTDWPDQAEAIISAQPRADPASIEQVRSRILEAWGEAFG